MSRYEQKLMLEKNIPELIWKSFGHKMNVKAKFILCHLRFY